MLAAFGALTLLALRDDSAPGGGLADYQGLFWHHPWLAGVLMLSLLSLAGIPLTMGFVAKFYLFAVGVGMTRWLLIAGLLGGTAIGFYYYLRVILRLLRRPDRAIRPAPSAWPLSARLVVFGASGLLLLLGIYPAPLIALLHLPALLPG